jgi:outer membrane protein assembly factor BamB/tetratricopeptide (TPR) repeat protein
MTRLPRLLVALAVAWPLLPSRAADPPKAPDLADRGRLTLPADPKLRAKYHAAQDYVASEDWKAVAGLVQSLLDLPSDVFIQLPVKGPDGKPVQLLVSARTAAERLLAGLPEPGLAAYEAMHGDKAAELLAKARKQSDKQLFAEVAQRYLFTRAGPEAAERLGTIHVNDGDFAAAARQFDRLVQRVGVEKLEPLTLYNAARAFAKGDTKEDRDNKEKVWKQLTVKAPKGLRIGDRDRTLKELEEELQKPAKDPLFNLKNWPMPSGNPSRNGQGVGDTPFMQPLWRQSLFSGEKGGVEQMITGLDNSVVRRLEARGEAVIPAFAPITATVTTSDGKQKTLLIHRNYEGVVVVGAESGKREWTYGSPWSMERMHKDGQKQQSLNLWVGQFKDSSNRPNVLIENSTVGTLSTDGKCVYFIDDLQVPPFHAPQIDRWGGAPPPGTGIPGVNPFVSPGIHANTLDAVTIASGKLQWVLGGPIVASGEDDVPKRKHDFRNSHFLGAPLPLDGKLYFLNEKDQEIRLVCLDASKLPANVPQPKELDEAIAWVQPLGIAKGKLIADYGRRIHAAHIAYGEGILVCPTNAGVILGVDLLTHSLVWAHAYSDAPLAQPNPNDPWARVRPGGFPPNAGGPIVSEWKATPPVVFGGKVVFAAPDSPELRCLSLRDGRLLWSSRRGNDDVYLGGVFAGRALVVGKKDVRALGLDDGKELWRLPTGMPSGRGTASSNIYYLPVKEAVFSDKEKGPGIVAIDVARGTVVAQTRSRKDPRTGAVDVPGNLTFCDAKVVAQSAAELVTYPQLKAKLDQMNELLAKNPNDPNGLFERGELRLEQGNTQGAVEDFRAALANQPNDDLRKKLRTRLYDALTDLLRRDFKAGEKYLKEYEDLINDPVELKDESAGRVQRRAGLLMLRGPGYESQGKAVDALNDYVELAALGDVTPLAATAEPAVRARPVVWARGRIALLYAGAGEPARKLLDEAVDRKWAALRKEKDVEALRAFVALFAPQARAGREAMLELAEHLTATGMANVAEAELLLTRLAAHWEDGQHAAQAVEALARLMTRKGLLEDAVHYYQRLAREYATTVVRDGKKGADYLEGLSADKRFIPYLGEKTPFTGKSNFIAEEERDKEFPPQAQHMAYTFAPLNEPLPGLKHYRFAVSPSTNHLMLVDRRDGKELLKEPIRENFAQFLNPQLMPPNPSYVTNPFGYHAVGRLIVANLGQYLVAVDTVTRRLLWEKNLLAPYGPGNTSLQYNAAEETLETLFPDGTRMTIAQGGPVTAAYVCYQTREGLWALDPLTGKTLWTRNDVPSRCRLFGDDQHIYLVELDASGAASATRAFRAQDGASVPVPNFAALYQKRQRIVGREMLVADSTPAGLALRLYDVHTGKDLWEKSFATKTIVLHSEEPELAGVIEPSGRLTLMDLRQRKLVLLGILDPVHVKDLKEAHLLADDQQFYVMLNTADARDPNHMVWPNLQPNTGLRGLTVHGEVYAFDRRTSKIRWHTEVKNQQFSLEQWKEMPVLLFTGRYQPGGNMVWRGGLGNQVIGDVYMEGYAKATGKLFFREPNRELRRLGKDYGQIYAINNDVRNAKIEMIANNYKVTILKSVESVVK